MMKIGFLQTSPRSFFGGYEKYIADADVHLSSTEIFIYRIKIPNFISKVIYQFTGEGSKYSSRISQPESDKWLPIIGAWKKVDLIYIKNDVLDLIIAKLFIRNIPIVIGVHTSLSQRSSHKFSDFVRRILYSKVLYRYLSGGSRYWVHCVALGSDSDFFIKNFQNRVTYIPNYLPKIGNNSSKNRRNSNEVIFLFLGRLEYQKGFDLVVSAYQKLVFQGLNIRLIVAGEGSLVSLLNDETSVDYRGFVDDVESLMVHCDWIIIPSRWEQAPLVVREAVRYGVPYIISNIPAFDDFQFDSRFVCDLNIEDLAKSMKSVTAMSDKELQNVIDNINEISKHQPTIEESFDKLENLFIKIIEDSSYKDLHTNE